MGPVSGDLKDVQFTEVIDIAAHVQAAAPVRGILMTREVADCLPEESLIPLKEPVDGHEVLLAYNPTVDS
jgi:class 3 adenylate cyclase